MPDHAEPSSESLAPSARVAGERLAYSPAEAGAAIGCTRKHIYTLLQNGQLHAVKVGRLTRIRAEELHRLLAGGDA